ncbi:hypothetical protein J7E62_24520 [Variovorax paradoxus]|nr:hypothetical protein [Variovorax paradoxus]
MGWSYSCDVNYTLKDQLADFRTPGKHYSAHYRLVRSACVGNHHWALLEDTRNGHHTITLDLMQGPSKKHGMGAGYKGMSEDWGPCYYDCPLTILDNARAPETLEAYLWRQTVRAHHATKKAKKKALVKGALAVYGGHTYRLDCPSTTKRGAWHVDRMHDGLPVAAYRMSARQLSDARIVTEAAQ